MKRIQIKRIHFNDRRYVPFGRRPTSTSQTIVVFDIPSDLTAYYVEGGVRIYKHEEIEQEGTVIPWTYIHQTFDYEYDDSALRAKQKLEAAAKTAAEKSV
jgi:hypothetical protein